MNHQEKQAIWNQSIIFEKSQTGLRNSQLPPVPSNLKKYIEKEYDKIKSVKRTAALNLPEMGELEVLRHYTRLSQMNFGVQTGFYPLGSCTMKYNPIINDKIANLDEIALSHPDQPIETIQGNLEIIFELQQWIGDLLGLPGVTLQPAAGAAGEYTGILISKAYHKKNGENDQRREIIVPDSAHGTNPASAAMAGFRVVIIPSNDGLVNIEALKAAASNKTALFMLTNPSTLGIFETKIKEITSIIHDAGGLCYYDGANLNAIMGITRPGDMNFDISHINLHKTFSTPHGGGGPGAGPVAVREDLTRYLPNPRVIKVNDIYQLDYENSESIGRVKAYLGNFGVLVRAYVYIYMMGWSGLISAAKHAVIASNYMAQKISQIKGFSVPFKHPDTGLVKHEFVASAERLKRETGITALDISKRLQDFNIHPPTVYFPSIVPEALMIEPTETEPKANLDNFISALQTISIEAYNNPEIIKTAPHNMSISRIDEVLASRNPILSYRMKKKKEHPLD